LTASVAAIDALARTEPAENAARRKRQVRSVMQAVADQLGNTPAICRKSYVPAPLVVAFESGSLRRKAGRRSSRQKLLTALLASPAPRRRAEPDLRTQLERSVKRVSGAR
jgi:DNA topoisomerase-1